MPTLELPPAIPFTLQVKAVDGFPVPDIFAVKTCAPIVGTEALGGDTLTVISASSVTTTKALAFALATLVALIVALACGGRITGAV